MDLSNPEYGPVSTRTYGFDGVGKGWHHILEALNLVMIKAAVRAQHGATLRVVQVKEKFGGLRVYWEREGFDEGSKMMLVGAVTLAENLSRYTCEVCGVTAGVKNRPMDGREMSRTLTLCPEHHRERDETGTLKTGESQV